MRLFLVIAAIALLPTVCSAEEIVVTGSRVVSRTVEKPIVALDKRADFVVESATIECDTRDKAARIAELRATLKNMMAEAKRDNAIDLGLSVEDSETGEQMIYPLTDRNYDSNITPSGRRDAVSDTTIIIKTPVGKSEIDELAARTRIKKFVAQAKMAGRSLVSLEDGFALSIVNPEQYRTQLLKMILANAKETAAQFGPNYRPAFHRMERQVSWTRTGPIGLSLFIPYELSIAAGDE